MVDIATLRRLVLALPEATDASTDAALRFEARGKQFAWSYYERVAPKKPRVPRLDVIAVRCSIETKEMLIESAPERFFDEDHYRGYPAVLVRLAAIEEGELAGLLEEASRLVATPKRLPRKN